MSTNHSSMDRSLDKPDFLKRLGGMGDPEWSPNGPTRLLTVSYSPGRTHGRPMTGFLHREEAEALQLSVLAQARALEDAEPGQSSHVLYPNDERTFGANQFLVVDFDKAIRPIRAYDGWGFFRNNLGEKMTHEYEGSRVVQGGIFTDTSPQRFTNDPGHVILDPRVLPVQFQHEYGTDVRRGAALNSSMILANEGFMDASGALKETVIGGISSSIAYAWNMERMRRPPGAIEFSQ